MPKERQEHVAIIDVRIAVFTKKDKELHGPVMNQQEMSEMQVPHMKRIQVSGFDKFECMKKVRAALKRLAEEESDE